MLHEPITLESNPVILCAIAKASARAGKVALREDLASGRTRNECRTSGAFTDGGWTRRTALALIVQNLDANVSTESEEWDPKICSEALSIFADEYRLAAAGPMV